ncbi:rhombosortase [Vibrio sp.]|nr:rhombosortase [Vibrio sp.]
MLPLPIIITCVLCVLLQFEPFRSFMVWSESDIKSGDYWRIITGNFTHTNTIHLIMNLIGLVVIQFIFQPPTRTLSLLLIGLSTAVGLANLMTDMVYYSGLSGVLHGLFIYCALMEALNKRKSSWLLVTGIILKVGWENTLGSTESTAQLIGARVAVEAHLFGLLSGLFIALFFFYSNSSLKKVDH